MMDQEQAADTREQKQEKKKREKKPQFRHPKIDYPAPPDGLLLVDKDQGFTSHNAVALCRGILHTKRVGHCGTLDPMATGMLLVVIGKATKYQDPLMCDHKCYSATMKLGIETNSQDADGQIVKELPTDHLRVEAIEAAFQHFTGEFDQVPPMYSAVKINGVPCYKLARKGQEIERKARRVTVLNYRITRIDLEQAEVDFELHCSKGFYVRTYAHEIGQMLACGAHLTALRRTQSGRFHINQAIDVPTLKACNAEQLAQHIIPLEKVIEMLDLQEA